MAVAISFWVFAAICCGYGALFGGRDGKWVASLYMGAILLTVPAQLLQQQLGDSIWPVILVDTWLLCGLCWVAMRTNRYWPLWVAGFHIITMTAHLAALISPSFTARVYFGLATMWAIPKLLVILIGVAQDRRFGITDRDPPSRQAP